MVGRPGKYQPRFTSGELDPLFAGNTDQGDYFKGAQLMQNARPLPQGGFANMWGTKALGKVPALAGGGLSNVRVRSFTHSRDVAYDFVFYHQAIDVYGSAGKLATIAIPHTSAQIPAIKELQQLDTMVLFHQDVQPQRIMRQGSDISWAVGAAPFANIPNYDYGEAYTNGVAAVWAISFFNAVNGNNYTLSVNGVITPALPMPTSDAAIQAAILALPGVSAGVTVTSGPANTPGGTPIPSGYFGIEFSGDGNEGDGWAVSGQFIDNSAAAITSAHLTRGVLGGEPIMSAARGWPACGVIYGARLVVAGFKSLPHAFLASQVGNYWNLDTRLTSASAPMLVPVDVDGAATILDIHKGRTLDLFTDGGEYWLNGAALDRTQTPVIVLATTNGVAPGVPVMENEGATIYADRMGGALWEFRFDYSQQNYASNNMSVRSASLVQNIGDMAVRRLTSATQTNELWALRADGMAVVCNLLRNEQITAFARRVTDGSFQAVNVNDRHEITAIVQRQVNGAPVQFVERVREDRLLDQSIDFNLGAPGTVVTGLADLEGAIVWAIADNIPQGPYTVVGGQITLGFAAISGYVGRWTPPRVLTMPQPRDVGPRTVVRRPCRVHTVRLRVVNTSSIAIGANGRPAVDIPLARFGGAADVPLLTHPFTGEVPCEGLQGFSDDGVVEITQVRPGLLNVTGVTVEVDL